MWDDKCRQLLDDTLNDNRALDGFTLMMYGQGFSTGRETVEKMCSYDAYLLRVGARLASPTIDDADERWDRTKESGTRWTLTPLTLLSAALMTTLSHKRDREILCWMDSRFRGDEAH